MRGEWYVLANWQEGAILNMRIVAGPITFGQAQTEQQQRARRKAAQGVNFVLVEFDPYFALTGKPVGLPAST